MKEHLHLLIPYKILDKILDIPCIVKIHTLWDIKHSLAHQLIPCKILSTHINSALYNLNTLCLGGQTLIHSLSDFKYFLLWWKNITSFLQGYIPHSVFQWRNIKSFR